MLQEAQRKYFLLSEGSLKTASLLLITGFSIRLRETIVCLSARKKMLPKKIIGKRIYLRPLKKSDAKQLVKVCHDRSIHRFTRVPYPYRLKDALAFMKRTSARRKNRSEIVFGIISNETKELMGTVSFVRINKKDNKTEIGYVIVKHF